MAAAALALPTLALTIQFLFALGMRWQQGEAGSGSRIAGFECGAAGQENHAHDDKARQAYCFECPASCIDNRQARGDRRPTVQDKTAVLHRAAKQKQAQKVCNTLYALCQQMTGLPLCVLPLSTLRHSLTPPRAEKHSALSPSYTLVSKKRGFDMT